MKRTILIISTALAAAGVLRADPILGNLEELTSLALSPSAGVAYAGRFSTGPAVYSLDQVSLEVGDNRGETLCLRVFCGASEVAEFGFRGASYDWSTYSWIAHYTPPSALVLDRYASYSIVVAKNPNALLASAVRFTDSDVYQDFAPYSGWAYQGGFRGDLDPSGLVVWSQPGIHIKLQLFGTLCNRLPDVSRATASIPVLWPPNGKMTPFQILGVTDPDGDAISVAVTRIRQDEPVSAQGDAVILADGSAMVRADRSNSGNGRVYTIEFQASDGNGGVSSGVVKIPVPRDFNRAAVDEGPIYTSTQPSGPSLLKAR